MAAEALASKIREKLKAGELQITPEKKIPTFGEFARKWLSGYGETHLKYSIQKGYDSIMGNHLESLMDRLIDQINRPELKEMIYGKLKDDLAPVTVTRIKALISGVLSHALEDCLIAANPVSRLGRLIKGKDRKADVTALTRDEARAFLEVVAEHYPHYHSYFLCALRTGRTPGPGMGRH